MSGEKKVVYCSGPMFSPEDHWGMQQIAAVCEGAGYETYLPQRDGLELGPLVNLLREHLIEIVLEATVLRKLGLWIMQIGFALDIYQLHSRGDAVVFNMNGRVPDEGSVMETSSAFTAGIPVVVYKDTPVTLLSSGFDNPMLQGLAPAWTYAQTTAEIPTMLDAAFAQAASDPPYTYTPTPHINKVIELGAAVWAADEVLKFLHDLHGTSPKLGDLKALGDWLEHHGAMIDAVFATPSTKAPATPAPTPAGAPTAPVSPAPADSAPGTAPTPPADG